MSVISLDEWRKKQASSLNSKYLSPRSTQSETTGLKLTKEELELERKTAEAITGLCFVIWNAWTKPFSTRGTIARTYPELVGICASEGLITMKLDDISWGKHWLATDDGVDYLKENQGYDGIN